MHYVYLIRDKITKETYVGYTEDLKRRIREHYTKHPELLYYEAYKSEKDARLRERKLKQRGQSIRWLKQRTKNCFLT
jgi:predicted GIY-YIG superfamily endonuclease